MVSLVVVQAVFRAYCITLFFRRILISRFPYVKNSLHFNFADFPVNCIKQLVFLFLLVPQTDVIIEVCPILLFTLYNSKNIAHHITEELIFYVDKITVMGNSKNSRVFILAILCKTRKSRKFDAREIYMFYSISLAGDTSLCVHVCGSLRRK